MSSKEFITGFIELYHKNECLWKITCTDYTNKNLKIAAYKELIEFSQKFSSEADIDFVKKNTKSKNRI